MSDLLNSFEHLYIHEDSWESEVALRLRSLFAQEKTSRVSQRPFPETSGQLEADEFDRSKKNIYVTTHKGAFFKQCPGAKPGLVCCNYFVLNLGLQCNMNCSYCYLQSYLNTPILTIYSNIDQALNELKILADEHPEKHYRVGTGETIDSLSLDPLTLYSHKLINFFRAYPNWTLELKTKSASVDQFIDVEHAGNVLVSWSINPQYIIEKEEHGTAPLQDRLDAADRCLAKGFKIAFHMDPMIWHEGWRENYSQLIDEITSRFKSDQIPHISLGTLRFVSEQKPIMRERFGMKSLVTTAEMFPGRDSKLRYDSRLRNEMFDFVLQKFRQNDRAWRVALCMETPESWVTTMDGSPRKDRRIADLFKGLPKKPEDSIINRL